jgi:hypothetical protein
MQDIGDHPDIAQTVRRACIEAALAGYEEAGIAGLCHEGAWEAAVDAMRALDLDALIEQYAQKHA